MAVGDTQRGKGITYDATEGACGEVGPRVELDLSLWCKNSWELRLLPRRHSGGKLLVKGAVAKLRVWWLNPVRFNWAEAGN